MKNTKEQLQQKLDTMNLDELEDYVNGDNFYAKKEAAKYNVSVTEFNYFINRQFVAVYNDDSDYEVSDALMNRLTLASYYRIYNRVSDLLHAPMLNTLNQKSHIRHLKRYADKLGVEYEKGEA